jgi:hypothetical protein
MTTKAGLSSSPARSAFIAGAFTGHVARARHRVRRWAGRAIIMRFNAANAPHRDGRIGLLQWSTFETCFRTTVCYPPLTYQPCWHSLHAHRAFVIAASHFLTVALIY